MGFDELGWGQDARDGRWHRILAAVGYAQPDLMATVCHDPPTLPDVPLQAHPPDGATVCDKCEAAPQ